MCRFISLVKTVLRWCGYLLLHNKKTTPYADHLDDYDFNYLIDGMAYICRSYKAGCKNIG